MMKQRLKILHLIVAGQIGGAERFVVNLALRADQTDADHSVALMTPSDNLRGFFREHGVMLRDRGDARENPLAYLWRSWGPTDLAWLGHVIGEEAPDVLHCHTYGSHVLAARAGLRFDLPVIRTEHGVRHYRDPSCSLYRHWSLKHTTRIVAVSDFVARTIASLLPAAADKTTVVHNGIDLEYFSPRAMPSAEPFTVAVVSRFEPIKRLHLAIEAVALAPNVQLVLAGDGVLRASLENLVRRLGVAARIGFLGQQSDPRGAIASAHAVLNTTLEEGLSLSLIEAAAMGRPAIGFAAGGVPEVVVDGETGWLTADQSAQGLARLLGTASASEATKRGLAARQRAQEAFGIDTMCEAYGAVYRDVLSRL